MNTNQPVPSAAATIRADFAATASERAAIAADDLLAVNIDVQLAVTTALRAVPNLAAMRADVAMLPHVDVDQYDKIAAYAQALRFAQNRYVAASAPRASSGAGRGRLAPS